MRAGAGCVRGDGRSASRARRSRWRPASRRGRRRATPVPGLFLAGDWIDTGLPATIESAVRSGHRAAERADPGACDRPMTTA